MRKLFRRRQGRPNSNSGLPASVFELPEETKNKISQHFLHVSSLTELLQRQQLQRRMYETKKNHEKVLEILLEELEIADQIEEAYLQIRSYFHSVQTGERNLSNNARNHIQEKNLSLNKKIESIHDRQHQLRMLIEHKRENT